MEILQALILGAIQGVFEWLPVSSQGQVIVFMMNYLGISFSSALDYSVYLHFGTMLAAIVYFRTKIKEAFFNLGDETTVFLIIATLFSFIFGLIVYMLLRNIVVDVNLAMVLIGASLIITGIFQFKNKDGRRMEVDLTKKQGVLIGILQSLSIIPGISRSGITVSGLLFLKYKAEVALTLSFLLSIPLVFGATVGTIVMNNGAFDWTLIFGIITSFIFGLITIHYFLKLAKKIKFSWFCIIIGILLVGLNFVY